MNQIGFFAGTERVEITPKTAVSMGGFGQRSGKISQGVHDPLFAKALFLQMGEQKLLLISTDLISIPNEICVRVTRRLARKSTLCDADICLTASHTHSGPDVDQAIIIAAPMKDYLGQLTEALIEVGLKAMNAPQQVVVKLATAEVDFIKNRRQEGGPVDPRIFALQVLSEGTGKTLAVVFGVGCHPVCLGHDNMLISADYPGYAQRNIEQQLGAKNALFVNLSGGNTIPTTRPSMNSLDTRGYLGRDFKDAEKIGLALSAAVLDTLTNRGEIVSDFCVKQSEVKVNPSNTHMNLFETWRKMRANRAIIMTYLPEFRKASLLKPQAIFHLWRDASDVVIKKNLSEFQMQRLMAAVSVYLMMTMRLINPATRRKQSLIFHVIKLDDYRFMTLPGEVLVEVTQDWQARFERANRAFIIGLSNGFMGYLPHPSNFREPGADHKYETIMNALEPQATVKAMDRAEELSNKMEKNHITPR